MFVLVTAIGVGVSFVVAGLVAIRVRPHNRVGPLMLAVGVLWLLAKFTPVPSGPRAMLIGMWAAALAHLVVAFPTGRLGGPAARAVLGLAYGSAAIVGTLGILGVGSS